MEIELYFLWVEITPRPVRAPIIIDVIREGFYVLSRPVSTMTMVAALLLI
jgi:hypothetical protein